MFKRKKLITLLACILLTSLTVYYLNRLPSIQVSPILQEQIDSVLPENLTKHTQHLSQLGSRFYHQNKTKHYDKSIHQKKIDYITNELNTYGYEVSYEKFTLDYKVQDQYVEGINIFATITHHSNEFYEASAHYDTRWDSPGADDNISGVAGLLEMARILNEHTFSYNIRFCFFDLEEWGLFGSQHHVKEIQKNNEKVLGLLNLEMIGFMSSEKNSQKVPIRIPFLVDPPHEGNFIGVIGNHFSSQITKTLLACQKAYLPQHSTYSVIWLGGFLKDAARSDHSSYWNAQIPALMLTDTANFRNPHYHQPTDTIDKIDFHFLKSNTQLALSTLWHLAK